jgi:uncharacterized protein
MYRSRSRLVFVLLLVMAVLAAAPLAQSDLVMIPMRDGVRLATDVYLPESGPPPFPAVLLRSFYGRGNADMSKPFTAEGMAVVIQDVRGRGDSEGEDRVFFDDGWGERQDGADTVAWICSQDWCNGKVGTMGGSALGITQILMAPATDKVGAQSIQVASSNFYGQMVYQGGVFRKSLVEKWLAMVENLPQLDVWHSHPTYDDFWKLHNAEPRAPMVTAPGLHWGGWYDIFAQGTVQNFVTRQYLGGPGAQGNQKLIMGPWLHGPKKEAGDIVFPDNFEFDFKAYQMRFLKHWLLGEDNGIMSEPAVHYYVMGDFDDPEAPGNEWRTANAWPPFATQSTFYYLGADKLLTEGAPPQEAGELSYVYDPADPCPTHGGQNLLIAAGPFDQRKVSARPDVLVFETPVLEQPTEVTGHVYAVLHVSTDAPDTDFTAKLVDVYPDGKEILLLDNIQRLKFRNGFERPEPLPEGEIGKVTVDLWSVSIIFNKGHKIALHVSSSNYPRFEKNPNSGDDFPTEDNQRPARNTIHFGPHHPSALILPIRPQAAKR